VADPIVGGLSGGVNDLQIARARLASGSFPAVEDDRDGLFPWGFTLAICRRRAWRFCSQEPAGIPERVKKVIAIQQEVPDMGASGGADSNSASRSRSGDGVGELGEITV